MNWTAFHHQGLHRRLLRPVRRWKVSHWSSYYARICNNIREIRQAEDCSTIVHSVRARWDLRRPIASTMDERIPFVGWIGNGSRHHLSGQPIHQIYKRKEQTYQNKIFLCPTLHQGRRNQVAVLTNRPNGRRHSHQTAPWCPFQDFRRPVNGKLIDRHDNPHCNTKFHSFEAIGWGLTLG